MSERLFGVGLSKAIALSFFTMIMIIMLKVAVAKYPVSGVNEVVNTI